MHGGKLMVDRNCPYIDGFACTIAGGDCLSGNYLCCNIAHKEAKRRSGYIKGNTTRTRNIDKINQSVADAKNELYKNTDLDIPMRIEVNQDECCMDGSCSIHIHIYQEESK